MLGRDNFTPTRGFSLNNSNLVPLTRVGLEIFGKTQTEVSPIFGFLVNP